MLACLLTPLLLWTARNQREARFTGLSDIAGVTALRYHARRVKAQAAGQDHQFINKNWRRLDKGARRLPAQKAYNEHWRQDMAVFQEYPVLTAYYFIRSAAEHALHPSPDVLRPARMNFFGDFMVLALLWGGLLCLACLSSPCTAHPDWDFGVMDRRTVLTTLGICLLLTLSSGMAYGQAVRLRAPLELIVPLSASIGLLRQVHPTPG